MISLLAFETVLKVATMHRKCIGYIKKKKGNNCQSQPKESKGSFETVSYEVDDGRGEKWVVVCSKRNPRHIFYSLDEETYENRMKFSRSWGRERSLH